MLSATHLHAMLVHFPIALLLAGFLSEIIALFSKRPFFQQAAFYLLVLGTVGAITSYLAGNAAGEGMDEGALSKAMVLHKQSATLSLWLTIVTASVYLGLYFSRFRKSWLKIVRVLLFAAVVGSLARTGYLGGQLVYKHGAGVELALPDFSNPGDK